MKARTLDDLKTPTAAQIAKRVDELVADHERRRLDQLRTQYETQALTELTEQLNRGVLDDYLAGAAAERGMTFLRDVWPDHPAAGHLVGEAVGTQSGARPCGVRRPFRLDEAGVWFCDYWVASPVFPAGRLPEGAVVLAFLVDGVWRYGTPNPPQRNVHGDASGGFEMLRGFGLRVNPEPLRGSPERDPETFDYGGQVVDDGRVRSADDLLWRFVVATQNEVMAVVSA